MSGSSAMVRAVTSVLLLMSAASLIGGAEATANLNCVFLHGIGQKGPGTAVVGSKATDPNYARSELNSYWGPYVKPKLSAYCKKIVFYWTDSIKPWTDRALQSEYCAVIKAQDANIVFAHSMGGNIMTAAVANAIDGCQNIGREQGQIRLVLLQAPLKGSPASELEKFCESESFVGKAFAGVFLRENCGINPSTGKKSLNPGYASLTRSFVKASGYDLNAVGARKAMASLCGVSTKTKLPSAQDVPLINKAKVIPLIDVMDIGLSAIRQMVLVSAKDAPQDWKTGLTDGMVDLDSCSIAPRDSYIGQPSASHYRMNSNHAYGRGTYGDNKDFKDQQPIAFMLDKCAKVSEQIDSYHFKQIHDSDADDEVADDEAVDEESEDEAADDEASDDARFVAVQDSEAADEAADEEADEADEEAEDEAADEGEDSADEEASDELSDESVADEVEAEEEMSGVEADQAEDLSDEDLADAADAADA